MSDAGRLIVFGRRPDAGRVKTRLVPALGDAGAADLHRLLIADTLERLCQPPRYRVDLVVTDTDDALFRAAVDDYGVVLGTQRGADLGARMHQAFESALQGDDVAVLVGTDCPLLDQAYVARAFAALRQGSDAVLGPAQDGGYVLIGLRRPMPELFVDMPWGSATVMAETRRRLRARQRSLTELESLWDVDRPSDLARLWRLRPDWGRRIGVLQARASDL